MLISVEERSSVLGHYYILYGDSAPNLNRPVERGSSPLTPEHVHGSGISPKNARGPPHIESPRRSGTAFWQRQKTNKGLAQTSTDSLPARRKVDAASFPCFVLPPHDSGWAGRQGKEAQETDGSRQRHPPDGPLWKREERRFISA